MLEHTSNPYPYTAVHCLDCYARLPQTTEVPRFLMPTMRGDTKQDVFPLGENVNLTKRKRESHSRGLYLNFDYIFMTVRDLNT